MELLDVALVFAVTTMGFFGSVAGLYAMVQLILWADGAFDNQQSSIARRNEFLLFGLVSVWLFVAVGTVSTMRWG